MDKELFKKAYDLWYDFREEILYKNRYIVKHEILDLIKQIATKNIKIIDKKAIIYRARQFNGNDVFTKLNELDDSTPDLIQRLKQASIKNEMAVKNKSGFWGYNASNSFIPIDNDLINDGRANPPFIKYLYTAEDPYTAMVEVRPYLDSKVSIAEIEVKEPLKIADFSYSSFSKFDGFEQYLVFVIMSEFSEPSNSDKKSYIPTQYIAEFIKTLDFDGIRFNSSLHEFGKNVTIFNYSKCEPVGSKLYKIQDICFEAKCISPENQASLKHSKLSNLVLGKKQL